ncbi:MAG: sugar ABC transporter substrate-binding protein [Thermincola sp.]|jgi:ribose transport system substrate-binding protein|nr:sugar ABC transporter substrate-binding protein [Thermincola sp.]MDT3704598.1 sugar ABC transporter substrate-binding protein [Thermincola sp.]
MKKTLRKIKPVLVLSVIFMLAILFSGCGKSQSESKNTEKTNEKKTLSVGVVLSSSSNPLYVSMKQGIEAKGKELGVETKVFFVENNDQLRQSNAIQDLITSKVDALLVAPVTMEGAVPAYEAAKEAGIPIFSIARTIRRPDLETTFIGINQVEDGRKIGEWMGKRLNGKGEVAMLKGVSGASYAMDLEKGFKEGIAKYPDIKIVSEVNSNSTKEEGLKRSENILTANPELDGIYAVNDEMALGAIQAAESAGRLNKLIITGYGGTPPGLDAVKEGKMTATVANRPMGWGALGIQTVNDVLNGKTVSNPVAYDSILVDQEILKNTKPEDLK